MSPTNKDLQTINALKGLIMDGVAKANSGHPGGAMSSLDFSYILFTEYLKFDPKDTNFKGRDRFILSAGHESMLLYSLLSMVGYLDVEDLKNFRQLHSKTPGHPENFMTPGAECTTGPLGQGAAMAVGFAIASKMMQSQLDESLFSYKTYSLMGDGCMQEGVTLGAASLAGHLGLSNLVWYMDRNSIQLSGPTADATSTDDKAVFEGFGWSVIEIDGHNHDEIRKALDFAVKQSEKPTLIIGNTIMAKGAFSMEASAKAHGAPFKADEITATKKKLGLPEDQSFYLPEELKNHFQRNFGALSDHVNTWNARLEELMSDQNFKSSYETFYHDIDIDKLSDCGFKAGESIATRGAFGKILEKWANEIPNLVGGSADLEPSNMTGAFANTVGRFSKSNQSGRNIDFGVREFPMSAICNGIALHGGLVPFDATFLSFADYSRAALRLGAIQKVRVIHEFTHDSFYLGEDGPTHQPVEQVMSLRLIPDFSVMRPADAVETEVMMKQALNMKEPSAICLTRQGLKILDHSEVQKQSIAKGAYVVKDAKEADMIIFATGSEVHLAINSAEQIEKSKGLKVKVISMPCWELFDSQPDNYKEAILSQDVAKRVSIEAGTTLGWQKYTGTNGLNIGIDHYGASAPASDLEKLYGFTPDQVFEKISAHFSL